MKIKNKEVPMTFEEEFGFEETKEMFLKQHVDLSPSDRKKKLEGWEKEQEQKQAEQRRASLLYSITLRIRKLSEYPSRIEAKEIKQKMQNKGIRIKECDLTINEKNCFHKLLKKRPEGKKTRDERKICKKLPDHYHTAA
ncbi:MAG: hypothetical protein ACI9AR_000007 [Flavobacteriaceae bacterium]|jgi:hypothetical protein